MSRTALLLFPLALAACAGSGANQAQFAEDWTAPAFRADHVGLFADQGDEIVFPVDVPANSTVLFVATRGGSGNADLEVRTPAGDVLCDSYEVGNEESCVIWDPPEGTLELVLLASVTFLDVELDFEMESEDPAPVPMPQALVIAQPSSDHGDVEVSFANPSRHGRLDWVVTPRDPDVFYSLEVDTIGPGCRRVEVQGQQTCSVTHPVLGAWDAVTEDMFGGSGQLLWTPYPLLVDEVLPESWDAASTTVTLPTGAADVLFEATGSNQYRDVRIEVSRGGFLLCDSDRQHQAWCLLDGAVAGDYQVRMSGNHDEFTLRVSHEAL